MAEPYVKGVDSFSLLFTNVLLLTIIWLPTPARYDGKMAKLPPLVVVWFEK